MEILEIVYHIIAFLFGIIMFSLTVTYPGAFTELILKGVVKITSAFTMFYAGLQLAIIFGLL